jgi:hypothetical protein
MKWFDEGEGGGGGENGIVIYPNLQTFRQIYTNYVKDQLAKKKMIITVKVMGNYQNQESY